MDIFYSQKLYSIGFNLLDTNGAAVDADVLPSGIVYINKEVSDVSVTITNLETGVYLADFTAPVVSESSTLNLMVKAVIDGVTYSYWKANGRVSAGGVGPVNNKWKPQ